MTEPIYIYIVRSDINDNNIYSEYENANDAIEYARHMKDELTYVDKVEVIVDAEGDIVEYGDSETIWIYSDEEDEGAGPEFEVEEDYWDFRIDHKKDREELHDLGDTTWFESMDSLVETLEENEDMVECKECFDLFPKADCVKLEIGYVCPGCAEYSVADEDTFKVDFPEYEKFVDPEDEIISVEPKESESTEEIPASEPVIENEPISTPEEAVDFLVKDEKEAIAGYEQAAEVVEASDVENKEEILDTLDHIKEEEEEHIEELQDLVDDEIVEVENDPISTEEVEEPEEEVEEIKDPESETLNEDTKSETRYWICFYDNNDVAVIEAADEIEAEERFVTDYSDEYFFDSWDHDWHVDEISKEEYDEWEETYSILPPELRLKLTEHVNEEHPAIESEQELEGTDNAVVDCKVADVVTHSEDEKPVDCEGKKKPLEKPLTEETHAQYAKPEGDKIRSYNNALKYAKQYNTAFIYGYTNHTGKFFALDQPIKIKGDPVDAEKEFRNKYKNCTTVYTVFPNASFFKESLYNFTKEEQEEYGFDEDGCSIDGYDEWVRCNWCKEPFPESDCVFELNLGYLCDRCQEEIRYHGGPLTIVEEPTEEEIQRTLEESAEMTAQELKDKFGTDDVDLINAGREEEDRVALKEDTEEEASRPVEMANTASTSGMDFETACAKFGVNLEN